MSRKPSNETGEVVDLKVHGDEIKRVGLVRAKEAESFRKMANAFEKTQRS